MAEDDEWWMGEAEDSLIKASNLPLNIKQTSEPRLLRSHQNCLGRRAPILLLGSFAPPCPAVPEPPTPALHAAPACGRRGLERVRGTATGGGGKSRVGPHWRDPKERGEMGKQQPPDTHPWVPASVPFCPPLPPLGKARTKHMRRWFPRLCPDDWTCSSEAHKGKVNTRIP